jgi:5-formyltetrahydrofolate cyclo-ligase
MLSKSQLRLQLKAQRQALSPEWRAEAGLRLQANARQLPAFSQAAVIAAYVSIREEAPTALLLQHILESGKKLLLPSIQQQNIFLHPVNSLQELRPGPLRIPQPLATAPIYDPKVVQLFFIPGLGFDRQGGRLGFGAGHYDRLLPETTGLRIGLCWENQIIDDLPVEDHDQRLHGLVTEAGWYIF